MRGRMSRTFYLFLSKKIREIFVFVLESRFLIQKDRKQYILLTKLHFLHVLFGKTKKKSNLCRRK